MKTLNELTPKERLELYKKALKDWTERPNDKEAFTDFGLCFYFEEKYRITSDLCYVKEWDIHVKKQMKKSGRSIFLADTEEEGS